MTQQQLPLHINPLKHQEVDSIQMGVLPTGETYMSLRGLARFCGVNHSVIQELAKEWADGSLFNKGRGQKILQTYGRITKGTNPPSSMYAVLETNNKLFPVIHAVPETICISILQYYALHAKLDNSDIAVGNFEQVAAFGLRKYIYERLNFDFEGIKEHCWNLLKERILYNSDPVGYFTTFSQSTSIIANFVKHNIIIDERTMVDGSIGIVWGNYWRSEKLNEKYGERIKIAHKFPVSYPQRDPMVNAYPTEALPDFLTWLNDVYLAEKFGKYLLNKVKKGDFEKDHIPMLVEAVQPLRLNA
ncbi:hypothetical protein VXS05_07750 [Photobacterium toruni]|uniref:hypothetical protein n=1 Tax=Photobacterium toruni TaxID=1935446 RepID=UPI002E17CC67|nr:hypothetical protein [Photobacterium toruni]